MLPPNAVWFITGCSTGIGAEFAKYVVDQGNRLVATARKLETLSYLEDSPNVLKLSLDVCDRPSIDAALDAAIQKFGRIDVVINNAGQSVFGYAENISEDTMRSIMDINFWGPMDVTRKAIGIFRDVNPKSGSIGGTIVNVSSVGGRMAFPIGGAYHPSKFALEGFTEAIATELDPDWKIRFMLLEPGATSTSIVSRSQSKRTAPHPAYTNPNLLINKMLDAVVDPNFADSWNDPKLVAKAVFDTLQKDEIPFRLPTGSDAYQALIEKETKKMAELEKWKDVTLSVGQGVRPETW